MDDLTRATRLLEIGDYAAAEVLLRELAVADPESPEPLNKLGITLTWQGRLPEALDCFDKCIASHPKYANAHSNRGNVLKEMGRPYEAIASYKMATDVDPGYATAYHNLGVLYKELGELDKAVPLLKQGTKATVQGVLKRRLGDGSAAKVPSASQWQKLLLLGALAGLIISIFAARR